jgi:UDP-GlcNAc:undecaprenyl-phosphate GlcNAc-1-phosphate transferase
LYMFDGINLQVGSYVFFIFLFFIFKGILINFSIVMLISLIFFLILNFRNKIYMGNNGVFLLSFVISYIFIKSYNNNLKFYADEIFIIMLLPGIDMFRLFLLRIINGVNPFAPDTHHIHHLLRKRFNFTQTFIITQFLIIFFVIFYYYIDFRFLIFIFISLYSVLLFSITRK